MYTDVAGGVLCVEQLALDYDGDCRVTIVDFAVFAENWMLCNEVPACLDQHMPFEVK